MEDRAALDLDLEQVAPGARGLVLEGGGVRGIYSAGILDVMMEHGIEVDGVVGVSAGAIHGSSYISGQPGRGIRLYLTYSPTPEFMGWRNWFRTGDFVDYQFAYVDMCNKLVPFDYDAMERSPVAFYTVSTDVDSGKPYYHRTRTIRGGEMQSLRASASLPLVSRLVEYEGHRLLDGGASDSIPVRFLRDLGYTRTVVVLTQVAGYRKKPQSMGLFRFKYRKFPGFLQTMESRHETYNATLDEVTRLEEQGEVFVFRPSKKVKISRLERDPRKILAMYELGRQDALNRLGALSDFLGKCREV